MPKNLEVAKLIDAYGRLLSEKQLSVLEQYYFEDYSLAEIAQNENISRQGVNEAIKRAENLLSVYEEKLNLIKKNNEATTLIKALKNEISNEEASAIIGKLEKLHGI